jgi:hypothetical protein
MAFVFCLSISPFRRYSLTGHTPDLRDPSTIPLNFTRSINLALSERGINSMRKARCPGLVESVLAETIPMHGRMIHGRKNGRLFEESQAYDIHGRVSPSLCPETAVLMYASSSEQSTVLA